MARELDPLVDARSRTIGLILVMMCTLAIIVVSTQGGGIQKVTNKDLIWFALALTSCCFITFGVFRRRFLTTLFNRRMAAFMCSICIFILINRVLGWYSHQSPEAILGNDTLSLAGMISSFAAVNDVRLFGMVLWFLLIRFFMVAYPESSAFLFTLSGTGACALFVWLWRRPKTEIEKTQLQ